MGQISDVSPVVKIFFVINLTFRKPSSLSTGHLRVDLRGMSFVSCHVWACNIFYQSSSTLTSAWYSLHLVPMQKVLDVLKVVGNPLGLKLLAWLLHNLTIQDTPRYAVLRPLCKDFGVPLTYWAAQIQPKVQWNSKQPVCRRRVFVLWLCFEL